jgi:transposase
MTIMLETGKVERFPEVGNFSSYCRKVPTEWKSNDMKKGKGNRKNGNKYLAWAFTEAAEFARRYDQEVKAFYNRKVGRTNRMIAHSALAHKLARAAYYIMRDGVEFDHRKLLDSRWAGR